MVSADFKASDAYFKDVNASLMLSGAHKMMWRATFGLQFDLCAIVN